jgi:TonB family protein
MLDSAALEAARRFVFQPALSNGHPVPVWVAVQFRFRLHE